MIPARVEMNAARVGRGTARPEMDLARVSGETARVNNWTMTYKQ